MNQGMRFILCGSYPFSGGWNDYVYEFATKREALLAAVDQLDLGCSVTLLDQETGLYSELHYKYDGLGLS